MSHHIIPCHVLSYGTILYHILSYHVNLLDIIYDTYYTSYYISYYHVLFIMYHLLLIIGHAPHITYDVYIYIHDLSWISLLLSLQTFQLHHFVLPGRINCTSYHVIYLPDHVASSHAFASCPSPILGGLVSISKGDSPCVHQVFDVLFYMDAEGQSYDLRQTPLKAPQK